MQSPTLLLWEYNHNELSNKKDILLYFANIRGYLAKSNIEVQLSLNSSDYFRNFNNFNELIKKIQYNIEKLEKISNLMIMEQMVYYDQFIFNYSAYKKYVNKTRDFVYAGNLNTSRNMLNEKVVPLVKRIESKIQFISKIELAQFEKSSSRIKTLNPIAFTGIILAILMLAIIGFRTSKRIGNDVMVPISEMITFLEKIEKGDYSKRIKFNSNDEMGILINSFNEMVTSFERITEIAYSVSRGDFSSKIEIKGEGDKLGYSIKDMNLNLSKLVKHAKLIAEGNFSSSFELISEKDETGKSENKDD